MVDGKSTLIVGAAVPEIERLARALAEMGAEVTRVATVDLASAEGVTVAFFALTAGTGVGVLEVGAFRAIAPSVPIVALLARGDGAAAERALESGADELLFEPFEDVEVRARLRALPNLGAVRAADRRKADDSRLMFELTQALASSLDFEDILFTVVQRIAEVVQVDRCSIVLTGVSAQKGYVVASSEDRGVRDLPIDLAKYPEVQKVLEDGKPLVIDVGTDPLLDKVRNSIPPGGPATSAIFPIMYESRAMGVLFLRFVAQRQDLTERELVLCQAVANATAIALRNARFVHALRDEQKRISLARSEAERKVEALSHYADFFESSADGMLVVDAEGRVLYANPRMAALTGHSVQELTTRLLHDLVTEDEHAVLRRLLAGFARGAYPRGLDLEFRGAFDENVILSVSASSTLRLAQGVLLILRDVTAARATERELRRTKEFLEALIAQSVDAVIAADMRGHIMLFNPAAERVLGYRATEVLGEPLIEKLYPTGVARRIMALLRSPAHGGVGRLEQTRATILAKDGTEIPISMTGGMIYEYGQPRATFGIFTDLRERLEIENNLARMRVELMEREREAIAAQLAGAAAHELNQPLTSVMASVELLQRKLGTNEAHATLVEIIVAETERMARIVRKIGKITHYETTAYVGSTRIIDIDRAVEPSDEVDIDAASDADGFTECDDDDTDVGRPRAVVGEVRALAVARGADDTGVAADAAVAERADRAGRDAQPTRTNGPEAPEEPAAGEPAARDANEDSDDDGEVTHGSAVIPVDGPGVVAETKAAASPAAAEGAAAEDAATAPSPRAGAEPPPPPPGDDTPERRPSGDEASARSMGTAESVGDGGAVVGCGAGGSDGGGVEGDGGAAAPEELAPRAAAATNDLEEDEP